MICVSVFEPERQTLFAASFLTCIAKILKLIAAELVSAVTCPIISGTEFSLDETIDPQSTLRSIGPLELKPNGPEAFRTHQLFCELS